MEYHDLGVALRLSSEAEKDVYRIANMQQMRWRGEGEFFLTPPYLPHVTLYQGRFVHPTIDNVTLGKLCAHIVGKGLWTGGAIKLLDHLLLVRKGGWIFWPIELTRELRELHEEVAAYLQRTTSTNFRESAARVLQNRDTPRDVRERIRKFGGVHTGSEYRPHITIGRLAKSGDLKEEALPRMGIGRLVYPSMLIIGAIDENGRMREDQVFWKKPMVELERRVVPAR